MKTFTIGAVLALGLSAAMPALAQDTSGQMGTMSGNSSMSSGAMASGSMTKSQMAMMKRCQAMSSSMMMKNKKCAAMSQAHPEMMQATPPSSN